MMKTFSWIFLWAATLLFCNPLWACACCSSEGDWGLSQGAAPDIPAERYLDATAAAPGEADVCPLFEGEEALSVAVGPKGLLLSSKKDKARQIQFLFPKNFEHRRIDAGAFILPKSQDPAPGLGPVLYVESMARGKVLLKGAYAKDAKGPIPAFLVYQGAGRGCFESDGFESWFLRFELPENGICLLRARLKASGK